MAKSIPVKLLHPKAKLPVYSTELASGCDLHVIEGATVYPDEIVGLKRKDMTNPNSELIECAFYDRNAIRLQVKRHPVILRTGIAVQLETDEELEIRGRSGLGFKWEIVPFNGTVDADFTGEIKMKVWNLGTEPFEIEEGMRVAQGIIKKVVKKEFTVVESLDETERGENGFASTGLEEIKPNKKKRGGWLKKRLKRFND